MTEFVNAEDHRQQVDIEEDVNGRGDHCHLQDGPEWAMSFADAADIPDGDGDRKRNDNRREEDSNDR